MYSFVSLLWLLSTILFLLNSNNLLLSIILLEILGFILIYIFLVEFGVCVSVDFAVLSIFCVFVIEGVIALSGLIILVNSVGSDYISSSSFLAF